MWVLIGYYFDIVTHLFFNNYTFLKSSQRIIMSFLMAFKYE